VFFEHGFAGVKDAAFGNHLFYNRGPARYFLVADNHAAVH
jgi:hypothetical protein